MVLNQIVATTRRSLIERKQRTPQVLLECSVGRGDAWRNFPAALQGGRVKLIAEVKRASPSRGWLCPGLEVGTLVHDYAQGGAAAISVLTEPHFFKGDFADLAAARQAVDLPLLCKDFILDPYQVYEARTYGADAVLLITAILSSPELVTLIEVAHHLGMSALVEVHSEAEIEKAMAAKAKILGINNRNLVDFSVDINTTFKLRPLIPPGIIIVSESGIKSLADILALEAAGVNAVLVGETLVTSANPQAKLRELGG